MTVPRQGTYVAFDPNNPAVVLFRFVVDKALPDVGDIRGSYWTKGSPMGEWEGSLGDYPGEQVQSERSSSYSWVARVEKGVRINEPPFLIRIVSTHSATVERRDSQSVFAKCQHSWTGVYKGDDVVEMVGTQCYFEFDETGRLIGEPMVSALLKSNFKLAAS